MPAVWHPHLPGVDSCLHRLPRFFRYRRFMRKWSATAWSGIGGLGRSFPVETKSVNDRRNVMVPTVEMVQAMLDRMGYRAESIAVLSWYGQMVRLLRPPTSMIEQNMKGAML